MVKEFPLTLGEHFRALCEFTLPVSGPWFFAVCGLPHILLLFTFPAVVLVFGELSPGTGMGVTGPCPLTGRESRQPGSQHLFELLDVTAFFSSLFALHLVGDFYA